MKPCDAWLIASKRSGLSPGNAATPITSALADGQSRKWSLRLRAR